MKSKKKWLLAAVPIAAAIVGGAALSATAVVGTDPVPTHRHELQGEAFGVVSPGARQVLEIAWGEGAEKAGKIGGDESALVGPSAFAVTAGGEIRLLDQVNRQVKRFASTGRRMGTIAIPSASAQDIVMSGEDRMYLLDHEKELKVLEMSGDSLVRTITASPKKVNSGRFPVPTALQVNGRQVSVELGHEERMELTDPTGRPLTAIEQESAPFRKGREAGEGDSLRVHPEEVAADHVTLAFVDAKDVAVFRVRLDSRRPLESITDIQTDRSGNTYVLLHTMRAATDSRASNGADGFVLAELSPAGELVGQLDLPYSSHSDSFRELEVTPGGEIYLMTDGPEGVRILNWARAR